MKRTTKAVLLVVVSTTLGLVGTILWGADHGGSKGFQLPSNNHSHNSSTTRSSSLPIQQIQLGGGNGNVKSGNGNPIINNGIHLPGNIKLPGNGQGNSNGQNGGIVNKPFPFPNNGQGNGNGNGGVIKPLPLPIPGGQGNGNGQSHNNNNSNHHHHSPVVFPQQCYHPPVKCVPQVVVVQLPSVIVAESPLVQIPVSSQLDLRGASFGMNVGRALLQIGDVILAAEIKAWTNEQVTIVLPPMGLMNPTKAALHVVRADGQPAYSLPCQLVVPQTQP